jgi:hypothetical protein
MPDRLPPEPLPEQLWGDLWRFAAVSAADLPDVFTDRPIPVVDAPPSRWPLNLGLASSLTVPGVVIEAGRRSLPLVQWLQQVQPQSLHAIVGTADTPDGLILFAGEMARWILATYDDPEMRHASQLFEQRKQETRGLHFLLIQPDDSGMTDTGFWLLQG